MILTVDNLRHGAGPGLALALAMVLLTGCGGMVAVSAGGGGGDRGAPPGDGNGGDAAPVQADEIGIRFLNDSDVDVDTQFYATNDVLEDLAEDLFQPQYRIQASIGVAGTGIVQAQDEDQITFPCTESTIIGTEGGEFLDPDRGTLLGNGKRRISRYDLGNFDCGNTAIFAFAQVDGEYVSLPPVVDSR